MKKFLIIKERNIEIDVRDFYLKTYIKSLIKNKISKDEYKFLFGTPKFASCFSYGFDGIRREYVITPTMRGVSLLGENADKLLEKLGDLLALEGIDNVIK